MFLIIRLKIPLLHQATMARMTAKKLAQIALILGGIKGLAPYQRKLLAKVLCQKAAFAGKTRKTPASIAARLAFIEASLARDQLKLLAEILCHRHMTAKQLSQVAGFLRGIEELALGEREQLTRVLSKKAACAEGSGIIASRLRMIKEKLAPDQRKLLIEVLCQQRTQWSCAAHKTDAHPTKAPKHYRSWADVVAGDGFHQ